MNLKIDSKRIDLLASTTSFIAVPAGKYQGFYYFFNLAKPIVRFGKSVRNSIELTGVFLRGSIMSDLDRVMEKVQKLLNLAKDGNGATEAEASLAMEKAYAILAEHNLTLEVVQAAGDKRLAETAKVTRTRDDRSTNWSEKYYLDVWKMVAELNACYFWSQRPNLKKRATVMMVFGNKANVIMTHTMGDYLCQTMRRLARQSAKEEGRDDFQYINTYLYGMATRLCNRIYELKAKAQRGEAHGSKTGTTLPALANYYKEEYRQNYIALYGVDPDERNAQFLARREELAKVAPKEKTPEEIELERKAEEKWQKEWAKRCKQNQDKFKRQQRYLQEGGGYHKGYADADDISLSRQVDDGKSSKIK